MIMAISSEDEQSETLTKLREEMEKLDSVTAQFGRSLSKALASGISQGKGFEDILRNIGQKFLEIALRQAFKPLEAGMGDLFSGLFKGLTTPSGIATGAPLNISPFADGGVIGAPMMFPLGRGLGLAGERGAEAILPLARGSDGRLGVASTGGSRSAMNVMVSITTPDAESFRRSEAQVSAALARAVSRGQRNL
jgi:phage-related minor tail protein